jgi:hypothetical protein
MSYKKEWFQSRQRIGHRKELGTDYHGSAKKSLSAVYPFSSSPTNTTPRLSRVVGAVSKHPAISVQNNGLYVYRYESYFSGSELQGLFW